MEWWRFVGFPPPLFIFMTLEEFRILAYSVHGQPPEFWYDEGKDLLLGYINLAVRGAALRYSFYAFDEVLLTTIVSGGASFDTAFYTPTDPAVVRKVKMLRMVYQNAGSATNVIRGEVLRFRPEGEAQRIANLRGQSAFRCVYPLGRRLYGEGLNNMSVAVTANVFPDPITEETENHFFLEYGADWLLFRCIELMNLKLDEAQRVAITKSQRTEAWDGLVDADTDANSTDFIAIGI